jgi:endoglucanase
MNTYGKCVVGLTAPWLLVGCITSPVWDYGATADAKKASLDSCPNGMLDDGEDGNNQIIVTGGRDGYWFTFVDELGSTVEPKGDFKMTEGGREGSKYAARMTGKMAPAGDSLYAGMGFGLTNPKVPTDLSYAQGIRFWAKGPGKVRFKTPDINTEPSGDRCTDCYNDFGVDLFLQDDWVRYTVPFKDMQQQPGWGDRVPEVERTGIIAVQWQYNTPNTEYEIWVDDVEVVGCDSANPPAAKQAE